MTVTTPKLRVRWPIDAEIAATDNGEFMAAWLRVKCPGCGREGSPLMSRLTRLLRSYWSWVGMSYSAPHTDYETRCPGCKATYEFTTFWPQ